VTIGRVQTHYTDLIMRGPRRFDWRGKESPWNFWGEQSRWQRTKRPGNNPPDDKKLWLTRGYSAHHCRMCAALHHVFHERRLKWRKSSSDQGISK
jgi:hypothetical protein